MQQTDRLAFAELLTGVGDYYDKEISTFTVELFWNGLKHYDLSEIRHAFAAHVANPDSGQFRPKIADLIRALLGSNRDQAAVAWSKVDSAVRSIGHYVDVVMDDPIIHRAIADIGGWTFINSKPDKEWPFIQQQFEARYRAYKTRNEIPEYPSVLLGLANAQNLQQGLPVQGPTLVGDPGKCQQVRAGGSTAASIQVTHAHEIATKRTYKLLAPLEPEPIRGAIQSSREA